MTASRPDVDLGSVDGRARLAERARPLVGKVPQGVYRELLLDGLAERVGLATHKLEALLLTGQTDGPRGDRQRAVRRRQAGRSQTPPSCGAP